MWAVAVQVPDSCAPGARAAKDVWAAQQERAEPPGHTPCLHYTARRHRAGYAALCDSLTAQLQQHSTAAATHAATLAQLDALATAAACMLAAAQSATFDSADDVGAWPLVL